MWPMYFILKTVGEMKYIDLIWIRIDVMCHLEWLVGESSTGCCLWVIVHQHGLASKLIFLGSYKVQFSSTMAVNIFDYFDLSVKFFLLNSS